MGVLGRWQDIHAVWRMEEERELEIGMWDSSVYPAVQNYGDMMRPNETEESPNHGQAKKGRAVSLAQK